MSTKINSNKYQVLANVFSLTAFFRYILNQKFSPVIINYILKISELSQDDLKNRWDNFDIVFGEEYGKKISALSFSTITEGMGYLTDKILTKQNFEETIFVELGCGFSTKGLNLVNNLDFHQSQYFEGDKTDVTELKKGFYKEIENKFKTPNLNKIDVLKRDDFTNIFNKIKTLKFENSKLKKVYIFDEGLILYLNKKEQKDFYDNLRYFGNLLKDIGLEVTHMTPDIPSHENFTNWLVHEGFTLKDHLEVMQKVDPKIIDALHNTEKDFFRENGIDKVKKYYYDEMIISKIKTHKLPKYRNISDLKQKIRKFLSQDILFAWEMEL